MSVTRREDRPLRVLTYNVHSCVGSDGRHAPERIAGAIAELGADVVALQELDVEQTRSARMNQPLWIAERLGLNCEFVAARQCGGGHYGNAVLSRYPLHVVRRACFSRHGSAEVRAAQSLEVDAPGGPFAVINTHLGLARRERLDQARTLVGDWIAPEPERTLLCGDFNARPGSAVHRALCARLVDAQLGVGGARKARPTWPSRWPLLRIDHVFVSRDLSVVRCLVPDGNLFRMASDHLPLVVDVAPPGLS